MGLEIKMSVQTQSPGSKLATGSELARARTLRTIAIVIAVAAFGTLVYGFGMQWSAYYQVPAGLAAYAAVEWQRHIGKKIKALEGSGPA
jgi:hypothetical protein